MLSGSGREAASLRLKPKHLSSSKRPGVPERASTRSGASTARSLASSKYVAALDDALTVPVDRSRLRKHEVRRPAERTSPGPGQYSPHDSSLSKTKSAYGGSFGGDSLSKRSFKSTVVSPGPAAYNVSDSGVDAKKLRERSMSKLSRSSRGDEDNQYIPGMMHASVPKNPRAPGPGAYDVANIAPPNAKALPSFTFGAGRRSHITGKPLKAKRRFKGSGKDETLATYGSGSQTERILRKPRTRAGERSEEFEVEDEVPGPGNYETSRTTFGEMNTSNHKNTHAPGFTRAKRFQPPRSPGGSMTARSPLKKKFKAGEDDGGESKGDGTGVDDLVRSATPIRSSLGPQAASSFKTTSSFSFGARNDKVEMIPGPGGQQYYKRVAEEEKNPGPGTFHAERADKYLSKSKASPQVSFGHRPHHKDDNAVPGPGQYASPRLMGHEYKGGMTIGKATREQVAASVAPETAFVPVSARSVPGVGAYRLDYTDTATLAKKRGSGNMSERGGFGYSNRGETAKMYRVAPAGERGDLNVEAMGKDSPGPGSHLHEAELNGVGRASSLNKSGPAFSMVGGSSKRVTAINQPSTLGLDVAPGSYEVTDISFDRKGTKLSSHQESPAFSFASSGRDARAKVLAPGAPVESKMVTPGPGAFDTAPGMAESGAALSTHRSAGLPRISLVGRDQLEKVIAPGGNFVSKTHIENPAPGTYRSLPSLGQQTLSHKANTQSFKFGTSERPPIYAV